MSERLTLYTIGHSNHSIEWFIELLQRNNISALADVRSSPFSRYAPHFNQENIKLALRNARIHYVFLGRELGARSTNPDHYRDGKAQYELMAKESWFHEGLDRIRNGIMKHRIALMCSERDPLECHRTMLVGVRLRSQRIALAHIMANGIIESHEQAEQRMLLRHNLTEPELFRSDGERLAEAYRLQCELIQYEEKRLTSDHEGAIT